METRFAGDRVKVTAALGPPACRVICVPPVLLLEVMESTPAIVVNCLSRTVATDDAIVSGSAPGRFACTLMVGKSTLGRSLTGSVWYASTPKSAMAAIRRLVAMGLRMKISEKFTTLPYS